MTQWRAGLASGEEAGGDRQPLGVCRTPEGAIGEGVAGAWRLGGTLWAPDRKAVEIGGDWREGVGLVHQASDKGLLGTVAHSVGVCGVVSLRD